MNLRQRLILLLAAVAAFAVTASFATFYGIQLYVDDALDAFQRSMDQSQVVDNLSTEAREQSLALRDVIAGHRDADELYRAERDEFIARLKHLARFAPDPGASEMSVPLQELVPGLQEEFDVCLTLAESGELDAARERFGSRLSPDLLPALEARLRSARMALDESRNQSLDRVSHRHARALTLAASVGAFGAGLVAMGAALIRRWLIRPIDALQKATVEFGAGRFEHRVELPGADELGQLAAAMNRMGSSLLEAEARLRASEAKYRGLFENLRDAVVICDPRGIVVECHDSDTRLLGEEAGESIGRHLLDAWPHWRFSTLNWNALIERINSNGRQARAVDVELRRGGDADSVAIDLVAYPVEYGNVAHIAIVLRDVTQRQRLEREARRAEAMDATVTLARGVAHDFSTLLFSANCTLSVLEASLADPRLAERVRTAQRACGQAAALASRLLDFATSDRGRPEVLCLRQVVENVIGSLDETLFHHICVRAVWDDATLVTIDRNHITQIILNLLQNAREAMPDGGDLHISVGSIEGGAATVRTGATAAVVLTITDSGCGMTPEVKQRAFEPFFTTKPSDSPRARGMGLAIVYSAVRGAGGDVDVESEPDVGTTFRIYLPAARGAPAVLDREPGAQPPAASNS